MVGVGLNVVPHESLPETGAAVGEQWEAAREDVLVGVLNAIAQRYTDWLDQSGDADRSGALAVYRLACGTLGQRVRVTLPGRDDTVEGLADDIDDQGRLVVRRDDGEQLIVCAGDVVHVRPALDHPAGTITAAHNNSGDTATTSAPQMSRWRNTTSRRSSVALATTIAPFVENGLTSTMVLATANVPTTAIALRSEVASSGTASARAPKSPRWRSRTRRRRRRCRPARGRRPRGRRSR